MRGARWSIVLLVAIFVGCAEAPTEPAGADVPEPDVTDTPTGQAAETPASSPSPIPAANPSPTPSPVSSPSPIATPPAPTAPEPIVFTGNGDVATEFFTTSRKLLRVTMEHSGSRNFAVWLLDQSGAKKELMANEIGAWSGEAYFGHPAGKYLLDITADGEWTITIDQPVASTGTSAPAHIEGDGQSGPPGLSLNAGLARFTMSHEGSSNFAIWLYDADGNKKALLVNEIGAYTGSKAESIAKRGIYYLDVTADGTWRVDVTQ